LSEKFFDTMRLAEFRVFVSVHSELPFAVSEIPEQLVWSAV
jgi:hypothetical protein